ncbi:hypothetical protein BVRB_020390 [Beta vulgaris subsp. vulgaris]|uniref:tRNA (adenine(58)-N(1))-methyltransferase non-catalytic subunit TRM6 n=1 Tax=Beta vulgaris subsp. vulgaris TaxID=3555 RepID=A0A0J8DUR0_BETVV|nr:hypothetical protein BVRB_020390 [Beta vulgaris subsp. vulgaris]
MIPLVKPHDRILIAFLDGSYSMVHAHPNSNLRLNKVYVPIDPIIGRPYGTVFRLINGSLVEVEYSLADERTELDSNHVPSNDNSNLFAKNSAQKLTQAEIEELKKTVSGDELISLLAANSTTFTTKTEYSQEKYLKKKRKHHIIEIRILKPSALSMSRSALPLLNCR